MEEVSTYLTCLVSFFQVITVPLFGFVGGILFLRENHFLFSPKLKMDGRYRRILSSGRMGNIFWNYSASLNDSENWNFANEIE